LIFSIFVFVSIDLIFQLSLAAQQTDQVHVGGLFRGCKQHQIVRKKQMVDPPASNSDTRIDSLTRLWMSFQFLQTMTRSGDSTNPCQRQWAPTIQRFSHNTVGMDTNFWPGIQRLNSKWKVTLRAVFLQNSPKLFSRDLV